MELYIFPDIIVPNSKQISKRINFVLRSDILSVDSSNNGKHIFSQVWLTDSQASTISDISFNIIQNSNNILSLSISAEGCGAYCEEFTRYYSFNLNTGNKLTIDSIFTNNGLSVLSDSINEFRRKKIKNEIRILKTV